MCLLATESTFPVDTGYKFSIFLICFNYLKKGRPQFFFNFFSKCNIGMLFVHIISKLLYMLKFFKKVIIPLHKKCSYSELFWSTFSRISPYSVRTRENADQNNSEYGHFLRSALACHFEYFHF